MEELKNLNSLKDIVNIRFEKFKDKTAFIEKESQQNEFEHIKYSEIQEKINGLGTYLLEDLNLGGEKIAVIGENSYRWYVSYMAVVCGVGIVVPLDKGLPENEILNLLTRSAAKAIIYSSRKKDEINNIKDKLPQDMIYIDMNKKTSNEESLSWEKIIEKGIKKVEKGDKKYIEAEIDKLFKRLNLKCQKRKQQANEGKL